MLIFREFVLTVNIFVALDDVEDKPYFIIRWVFNSKIFSLAQRFKSHFLIPVTIKNYSVI